MTTKIKYVLIPFFIIYWSNLHSQKIKFDLERNFTILIESYGEVVETDLYHHYLKTEENIIPNYNKHERLILYWSIFSKREHLKPEDITEELADDIKKNLSSLNLTEIEAKTIRDYLMENFDNESEDFYYYKMNNKHINLSVENYILKNLNQIVLDKNGKQFKPMLNKKLKSRDGETKYMTIFKNNILERSEEYGNNNKIRKLFKFNSLGSVDTIIEYDDFGNIKEKKIKQTLKRDYEEIQTFFRSGKLFSVYKSVTDYIENIKFNENSDTIYYFIRDQRNLGSYKKSSFIKNKDGQRVFIDNNGLKIEYELIDDQIEVESMEIKYDSLFFININENLKIDTVDIFKLDTILKNGFMYHISKDSTTCVNMLYDKFKMLNKNYEQILKPYILLTCEMATSSYVKTPFYSVSDQNAKLTKEKKIRFMEDYKLNDETTILNINLYNNENGRGIGDFAWNTGMVKFMRNKTKLENLRKIYIESITNIESEIEKNFKVNQIFIDGLNKMNLIYDTLGNHFTKVRMDVLKIFLVSLSNEKLELLKKIKQNYILSMNNFLLETIDDNYRRSYGFQIARESYFKKINNLQLNHVNFRLYLKNSSFQPTQQFEQIISDLKNYLGNEKYSIIENGEKEFQKSIDSFSKHTMTAFNPYFSDENQKMHMTNWLMSAIE